MPFICISFFLSPQCLIPVTLFLFTTSLPSRKGRVLVSQSKDNSVLPVHNMLVYKHFPRHHFILILTLTALCDVRESSGVLFFHFHM